MDTAELDFSTCSGSPETGIERTIPVADAGEAEFSPEELQKKYHLAVTDDLHEFGELRTIGLGGIGAVFAAHEFDLQRDIALKMLRPRFRHHARRIDDVIREARITARIDHPNVVPVYQLGYSREQGVFFTMRRVAGRDLRTILNGVAHNEPGYRQRFTLRRRLHIFIEVCNGINFAHHNGILHCDLKPSNLMVGDYGEVQIMDWGMAEFQPVLPPRPESVPEPDAPDPKMLAGTPAYLAPERIMGLTKGPTILSDIYSLGVILYSVLAGCNDLYPANLSAEEVMHRVAAKRLAPVRRAARRQGFGVPRELEAICDKAMERDPERRYQSVGELLQDLHNYLDGYPVKAYHPLPGYRLRKLVMRRPLVPCALLAAILTWSGFQLYALSEQTAQENAMQQIAFLAFRSGERSSAVLANLLKRYHNLRLEGHREEQNELIRQINVQFNELEKNFSVTMDFLSQLPLRSPAGRGGIPLVARMIQTFYHLYRETGDESLLSELDRLRARNPELFNNALKETRNDAEIAALLDHPVGSLRVILPTARPPEIRLLYRRDDRWTAVKNCDFPEKTAKFPTGNYLVEYMLPRSGAVRQVPVSIHPGRTTTLDLSPLSRVPDGFILIPAGEYYFSADLQRLNLTRRTLPGCFIGQGEVTVGAYRKFWKQLPEKQKKAWLPWGFSGANSNLWLTRRNLPVAGIPRAAAEAYARWLGQKYGLTGRLPTYLEWLKAARGIDRRVFPWGNRYVRGAALLSDHPLAAGHPAGVAVEQAGRDRSPYGVCHLAGNVREWVRSTVSSGHFQAAAGGSVLSGAELARIEDVSFIDDRARDVGFRCLLELPKKP